jgi:ribose transport system permease protein
MLGMLVLLFGLLSEHFLSGITPTTLANQVPALTVIAVGMTFVLIIAGIDLSVGLVLALCESCASVLGMALVQWGWRLGPALMLGSPPPSSSRSSSW